ncbi:MAG: cysteine--tRNA ligase [Thermoplasmata archaeon]|nr:cysteine--tRNA ligase [Thermoplasmata archaeon]
MTLKIYNTISRKKEKFIPVQKGKVKMYVCGMTVYSDAHIGHARTYLAFDIIRRYLEYKGYKVTYVQNITDVDDKIIAAANEKGMNPLEYSKYFTERCLSDLDALGVRRADLYPKASENIKDMIEIINKILENGYGYISNGDVYFSVEKFKDYGKLSKQRLEEMKAGARIEPTEKKRNPLDFALWKSAKPGEPSWDSPWGRGRPGWHIECSTMSSKYLGLPFDIHGGGMDLIFPHHENEIAQAEAATGKKFVNYWIHVGLLTVNKEKMSKSLGNIINIRDAIKRWEPEVIRFFFASNHYRSPPDFNEKALQNAESALKKIYRAKQDLENYYREKHEPFSLESEKTFLEEVKKFKENFEKAMDDDFNTPKAIAEIFSFIRVTNKYLKNKIISSEAAKKAYSTLLQLGKILTLFQEEKIGSEIKEKLLKLAEKYEIKVEAEVDGDTLIDKILKIRENARKNKEWSKADTIRSELTQLGIEIEDTKEGTRWRKVK